MAIDLLRNVPAELAADADLAELLASVQACPKLDGYPLEVLDFVYRSRVARLLERRDIDAVLIELSEHIAEVATHVQATDAPASDPSFLHRCAGYRAIIEDRLAARLNAIPAAVSDRKYVCEILEFIATEPHGRLQRDVGKRFELKDSNLSQIIKLMRDWELIRSRTDGQAKHLSLGPRAGELVKPVMSSRRGLSLLQDLQNAA